MVRTQQAVRQPVEGADPHAALAGAHQLPDTMTHLRRRFVGKRHRHNRVWRAVFHAHQPGDTMHQYARLTTARARQHQKVAAWRGHRFALFVIKAVEQVRNVHWHRRVKIGWAEKRNALRQKAGYIYRFADYISEVRDANREISRCGSKRLSQVCIRSPFSGLIQQACIPLRIAPPTSVVRSSQHVRSRRSAR